MERRRLEQAVEQAEKLLDKKGPAGVCEGNIVPAILQDRVYRRFMPV